MANRITGKISDCGCFYNGQVLGDQGLNVPFFTAGAPPQATIPSLVNAVVNLQQTLNVITNRINNINFNTFNGHGGGFFEVNNKNNKNTKPRGLIEVSRVTKDVTIHNPNDKSQYVKIKQITALKLLDKATGETWTWHLS